MTRFHIKEDSESVVAGAESFREMQKYVEEKERECRDSRLNTALAVLSLWTFFSAVSDETYRLLFSDTQLSINFKGIKNIEFNY